MDTALNLGKDLFGGVRGVIRGTLLAAVTYSLTPDGGRAVAQIVSPEWMPLLALLAGAIRNKRTEDK